jgi:hypothetical protein
MIAWVECRSSQVIRSVSRFTDLVVVNRLGVGQGGAVTEMSHRNEGWCLQESKSKYKVGFKTLQANLVTASTLDLCLDWHERQNLLRESLQVTRSHDSREGKLRTKFAANPVAQLNTHKGVQSQLC